MSPNGSAGAGAGDAAGAGAGDVAMPAKSSSKPPAPAAVRALPGTAPVPGGGASATTRAGAAEGAGESTTLGTYPLADGAAGVSSSKSPKSAWKGGGAGPRAGAARAAGAGAAENALNSRSPPSLSLELSRRSREA